MQTQTTMRSILSCLFMAVAAQLCGQAVPIHCDNKPFLIYDDSNRISRLHYIEVDPVTNTATLIPFPNTSGLSVNAIGFRLQDKTVYGLQSNRLIRMDGTGAMEVLSTVSEHSIAGDVSPDGKYLVFTTLTDLKFVNLESGFFEETKIPFTFVNPAPNIILLDIAFNPTTGILYGFEPGRKRLVTIDPHTGLVDNARYPVVDISTGLPAMFFDAYGNLWGLSNGMVSQVSTITGQIMAQFPITFNSAGRVDGCSCPGSFNFQKSAWPDTVSHCGVFDFIFSLSNRTGQTQQNVALEDWMPEGISIEKIVKNPFGGQISSGPGSDHLLATNLSIPEGVDSLIIRVRCNSLPSGIYKNQALLKNIIINAAQTSDLLSDNPATHAILDSTAFVVRDLAETLPSVDLFLCYGSEIELDAAVPGGMLYTWNSGQTTPNIQVSTAGDYAVIIETKCEEARQSFHVLDASLSLDLGEDIRIQSGDTLNINPEWNGIGPLSINIWATNGPTTSISCTKCLSTNVFPVDNSVYSLQISNEHGCTASDEIALEVERSIYAPNVFSPSKPAPNNVFFIQSKNPVNILYLMIFSRWGELVFEKSDIFTNDLEAGWNGTVNQQRLSPGVFVWMAEVAHANGFTEKLSGDVTLID